MKNTLSIFFISIVTFSVLFSSCTNGGDIGYLYGQWMINTLTVDEVVTYDGSESQTQPLQSTYNWRFQGELIQLTENSEYQEFELWTGKWELNDDCLFLRLPHYDKMPSFLYLTEFMEIHIVEINNKNMVWSYTNNNGQNCILKMHKLL